MAKPVVCSACSPAARSQVWRQREPIQPACPTHLSWCVAQGWEPLSSHQTCPPACSRVLTPILLLASTFSSVTCMLHRLAEAIGSSRTELRPRRFITCAAVVTEWAALCPSRIQAWIAAGYLPPRISPSTRTAPITTLPINDSDGPMKAVGLQLCSR